MCVLSIKVLIQKKSGNLFVTEYEVRVALKQVRLNTSPELYGLLYEVYLYMSHIFVPILTNMFNHWFAQ